MIRYCLLASFLLSMSLHGQDPRGFVRGTVMDNSGAVIPGAKVRATNNETGVVATATANDSSL